MRHVSHRAVVGFGVDSHHSRANRRGQLRHAGHRSRVGHALPRARALDDEPFRALEQVRRRRRETPSSRPVMGCPPTNRARFSWRAIASHMGIFTEPVSVTAPSGPIASRTQARSETIDLTGVASTTMSLSATILFGGGCARGRRVIEVRPRRREHVLMIDGADALRRLFRAQRFDH